MVRTQHRVGALLAAGLLLGGCYGPFYLTRKVYNWNGRVGDKWVNEIVFLVISWVPVYSVSVLADALIFNSIEFWTGDNPMAAASKPTTKRLVRGNSEADLTYVPDQRQLIIRQMINGQQGPGLRIERQGDLTIASNSQGDVVFLAKTSSDGQVQVSDASGKQVASYSAEQVAKLHKSLPQ